MKAFRGAFPPTQRSDRIPERTEPDVTARVFENSKDLIGCKSVFLSVDGFGRKAHGRIAFSVTCVAIDAIGGGHPPIAIVILKNSLVPAPTVSCPVWQARVTGCEVTSIEAVKESVRICGRNSQIAVAVFQDATDTITAKAFCHSIGSKTTVGNFRSAACFRPQPDVAITVFAKRGDRVVKQTVLCCVSLKGRNTLRRTRLPAIQSNPCSNPYLAAGSSQQTPYAIVQQTISRRVDSPHKQMNVVRCQ